MGTWLFANKEGGLRHQVCHTISMPPVFTLVTSLRSITVWHVEHDLFRVNFELATAHYCPGLSSNATLPQWHDVSKKTLSPQKILARHVHYNNVNGNMVASKMTAVATMVMEEWQRLSSWDWLQSLLQHPQAMRLHHSAMWNSLA